MAAKIDNYYNRFDESLGYEEILFRDGFGAQGAEQNEQQAIINAKIAKLGRALFKDGDIVQGAQILVDPVTGKVTATAGTIFLNGFIWNVPPGEMDIPVTGTVSVGVHLEESIISELEDPSLRNPARGQRSEGEPGAWRKKVVAKWGFDSDGQTGTTFYPVYTVDDGVQRAKEAPPALDSFNQVIARYDRDSTGTGTYAVSGLTATVAEDMPDGRQVYDLAEGRARVGGLGVELPTSRRIYYNAQPDLRTVSMEVVDADETSVSEEGQRIDVAHAPLKDVLNMRITVEETVSLVHGAYSGCQDDLPFTGVTAILEVKQLDTVFDLNSDFLKKGDQIDWSPLGNEPSPGSTYDVKLRRLKDIEPVNQDLDGFYVKGAVAGTQILFGYTQMLPRIDRMAIDSEGQETWFKGIASERNCQPPQVPESLLVICSVYQDWRPNRMISNEAPRVVPFDDIAAIKARMDYIEQETARNRLETSIATREAGAKVGIFVDPLADDTMRDQGIEQTGAIVDGELMLPIVNSVSLAPSRDIKVRAARPYTPKVILEQPFRTGEMAINPYLVFEPLPAKVTLTPAIDQWTENKTVWTSGITTRYARTVNKTVTTWQTVKTTETRICSNWHGSPSNSPGCIHHATQGRITRTVTKQVPVTKTVKSTEYYYASQEQVSQTTSNLQYLRSIAVRFALEGFGPGEILDRVTFAGIDVTSSVTA